MENMERLLWCIDTFNDDTTNPMIKHFAFSEAQIIMTQLVGSVLSRSHTLELIHEMDATNHKGSPTSHTPNLQHEPNCSVIEPLSNSMNDGSAVLATQPHCTPPTPATTTTTTTTPRPTTTTPRPTTITTPRPTTISNDRLRDHLLGMRDRIIERPTTVDAFDRTSDYRSRLSRYVHTNFRTSPDLTHNTFYTQFTQNRAPVRDPAPTSRPIRPPTPSWRQTSSDPTFASTIPSAEYYYQPPPPPPPSSSTHHHHASGEFVSWMTPDELVYFSGLSVVEKEAIISSYNDASNQTSNVPLRIRLLLSKLPIATKTDALKRITSCMNPMENAKYMNWLDVVLKIPFGIVRSLSVSSKSPEPEIASYLLQCRSTMDGCIYGHSGAKEAIQHVVSSWIRTDGNATCTTALGIQGPMGIGKTTLIKNGLCEAVNRPFVFITCGGATGGSLLSGHSYTYEGSQPGAITNALISSQCMNPIIMLDEVDKISTDVRGEEIFNTLVHLLDPAQNTEFQDRFVDTPLDISNAFFVLTYNDANKIPKVLRDRINEIRLSDFNQGDKAKIAQEYLLPSILEELNLSKDWLSLTNDAAQYAVQTVRDEPGVRGIRGLLVGIVSILSTLELVGESANVFPDVNARVETTGTTRENRTWRELQIKSEFPRVLGQDHVEFLHKYFCQDGGPCDSSAAAVSTMYF